MDEEEVFEYYDEEEQEQEKQQEIEKIDIIPLKENKKSKLKKREYLDRKTIKIPIERILSFKTKLLNNFIEFLSVDDLTEMLLLNQKTSNIILNTNLYKNYLNIRNEFFFPVKQKKPNYREMIEIAKNKNDLKSIFKPVEKKLDFNKYNISQLLRKNCEMIRKYKSRLKINKNHIISIFGKIIENQLIKNNSDEINFNDYNLDNEGIEIVNYALSDLEEIKKIVLSNNTQLKSISSINNIINERRMDLQILNLSNNYIDDKFGVLLFDKLEKNCPNLKILNLSNNNLTNKVFLNPKIIEAFKNNKFQFIKKFIINHNLLGSKGLIQLFDLLLNCSFLNLLDLSYNGVNQNIFDSDNAFNFFDNRLYYFYTFYYEGNFLSSSETGNLVQCLLNNSTLTYLYLGNNQINDDSMKLLGFLLQNNTNIHSLHINYNDFSIKGIIQFFSSIKNKGYLIELNLANNKINQKGLKFIFDSLKNNHYKISSLNLSYNDLSKSSTSEIITNFIETNNTIKNLNLAACHIGLGAKRLFSVLENNKKISCLDLSVNDIGGNKEIFENISNYVKKNFYIKFLYLDGNFINDKDFEKVITDGIKYNKNLNLLSLKVNRINLENKNFEQDIIESLRLNDHIKEIRLDGNPIKNEKNYSLFKSTLKKNGTLENREYLRSNNID